MVIVHSFVPKHRIGSIGESVCMCVCVGGGGGGGAKVTFSS